MVAVATTSIPVQNRPRGKISLNGWDECYVNGRSLATLRNEMLREKKLVSTLTGHDSEVVHHHSSDATEPPRKTARLSSSLNHLPLDSAPNQTPVEDFIATGAQVDPPVEANKIPSTNTVQSLCAEKKAPFFHSSVEMHPAPRSKPASHPTPVITSTLERLANVSFHVKLETASLDKSATGCNEALRLENSAVSAENAMSPEPVAPNKLLGEKRKSVSTSNPEVKRRKQNVPDQSSPSQANLASRRSHEYTSPRSDWASNPQKHAIPSASEMDTDGLDPDAIEAVAVAAQAEKEEANSRARRTTRLAAGKIKQVDYKASASAPGTRSVSPGNEYDDNEVNVLSNDSTIEPARAIRRKTPQSQALLPQRSSRRVARMRSSQEKERSPPEEPDTSGMGASLCVNGSADRTDIEGTRFRKEMEVDNGSVAKVGTRAEGRERKRATSRRTRQNHTDGTDVDGSEKGDETRSSTREDSPGETAQIADISRDNDGASEANEQVFNPGFEDNVAFGWNYTELSRIGDAVDIVESIAEEKIIDELDQNENWKVQDRSEVVHERVKSYVEQAVASIERMKGLGRSEKSIATVDELRAYIATDVWRLKHSGLKHIYPLNRASLKRQIAEEEGKLCRFERARRKGQREVDDLRTKLDGELETRRKVDLEVTYADLLYTDQERELMREEARLQRLRKDSERYNAMEEHSRINLDRLRVLACHLRGEKDGRDDGPSGTLSEFVEMKQDELDDNNLPKNEKQSREEAGIEDEDVVMKATDDGEPAEKLQRKFEIDRYHKLISTWEGEAEGKQRNSERVRMLIVNVAEHKRRLESELYLSRSSTHSRSVALQNPTSARKLVSEQLRKGESRSSAGAQRGTSGSRGRPTPGKSSTPITGGGTKSGAGRPKIPNGKSVEATKVKRRGGSGNGAGL